MHLSLEERQYNVPCPPLMNVVNAMIQYTGCVKVQVKFLVDGPRRAKWCCIVPVTTQTREQSKSY